MKSEQDAPRHQAPAVDFGSVAGFPPSFPDADMHGLRPFAAPAGGSSVNAKANTFENSENHSHAPHATSESVFEMWTAVRDSLRATLGEDAFISWFGQASFEGCEDYAAVLSVPTKFLKSWIRTHYSDVLVRLFQARGLDVRRIEVSVRGSAVVPRTCAVNTAKGLETGSIEVSNLKLAEPRQSMAEPRSEAFGSHPDNRLTFDSFMVSQSNIIAHSAASRVASAFDTVHFNPLYIYGSVGLGKTHLLHALAHAAKASGRRVLYLTAETFRFGFLKALTNRAAAASFKETMRGFDLLLIDDLQFLQGKYTEAEFGHTLNALLDGSRQVAVACDRRPADLETFDERLRSRLGGGLVVEIAAPEEELRRKILLAKAGFERQRYPDLSVPESVIAYIARSVDSNGRDLEGALNRLVHYHQLCRSPITIDMAEDILRGFVKTRDPKRVKIDDIIRITAKYYNIARTDLLSSRRTRNVVLPRQIAMYLSKIMTPRSLPEIGGRFGNRDHTTVLHAVRKVENLAKTDPQQANDIDVLRQMILEA